MCSEGLLAFESGNASKFYGKCFLKFMNRAMNPNFINRAMNPIMWENVFNLQKGYS